MIPNKLTRSVRDCNSCIFDMMDGYDSCYCCIDECADIYKSRKSEFKKRSIYNDDFNLISHDIPCRRNISVSEVIELIDILDGESE
jgi:hypothetical protein